MIDLRDDTVVCSFFNKSCLLVCLYRCAVEYNVCGTGSIDDRLCGDVTNLDRDEIDESFSMSVVDRWLFPLLAVERL